MPVGGLLLKDTCGLGLARKVNKIINFIRDIEKVISGVKTKPYLKLCEGLPNYNFTLADARRALGTRPGSAKVILSRLKGAGLILSVGRGRYRLIGRENLARFQELRARDPKLYQLALELYRGYPDSRALVLYGSRISGVADELGDYDVMVVTEKSHERSETRAVERGLGRLLGVRVHLSVYSERVLRTLAMGEPHLKFWLNNAAVLLPEGRGLGVLPPTSKWGYKEALYVAEGYIDAGDVGGGGQAASYLTALRMTLMVEHALSLDYDYENVRKEVERFAGGRLVTAVRANPIAAKVGKEEMVRLRRRVRKKLKEVRAKLKLIGENESDVYLKELRR